MEGFIVILSDLCTAVVLRYVDCINVAAGRRRFGENLRERGIKGALNFGPFSTLENLFSRLLAREG